MNLICTPYVCKILYKTAFRPRVFFTIVFFLQNFRPKFCVYLFSPTHSCIPHPSLPRFFVVVFVSKSFEYQYALNTTALYTCWVSFHFFCCYFLMVFIALSFWSLFISLPYSRTIFIWALLCWISGLIFVLFVTAVFLVTFIPWAGNKVIWTQNKHVRQSITQWADVPFRFSHETRLSYVLLLQSSLCIAGNKCIIQ
jgi:hypothetical protein